MRTSLRNVACIFSLGAAVASAAPLGSVFTYQGRLESGGAPANGVYDMRFTLYDADTLGGVVGSNDCVDDVDVVDGLFTVEIDFGVPAFDGQARWLEIEVRPDAGPLDCAGGGFTMLVPRQPLTAVPYALHALGGGFWTADGGAISNSNAGFVGIRRSTTVTGAEYFGVQAPVNAGYGGMYIRTDGAAALPFYGYKAGATGETGWSYLDGATGDWRLNLDGDRLTVTDTGNVGIGTISPTLARVQIDVANQRCIYGTNDSATLASAYFINDGTGPAGVFEGNVTVIGALSKSSGSFRIDHPLAPAEKYLYHSFVESPDMMNIYNGNVVTDGDGRATVSMPDWFEALNRDFRYQLTVIGQFAQAIVEREMEDGRFVIRTDKPGVKVSWQVTGIRHDPWAEAHRIPVEQDKPAHERGRYQHPELYGQPREMGIHYEPAGADREAGAESGTRTEEN